MKNRELYGGSSFSNRRRTEDEVNYEITPTAINLKKWL